MVAELIRHERVAELVEGDARRPARRRCPRTPRSRATRRAPTRAPAAAHRRTETSRAAPIGPIARTSSWVTSPSHLRRRLVGHQAEAEHPHALVARHQHLGDGRHADRIGAEGTQHAQLRARLVGRARTASGRPPPRSVTPRSAGRRARRGPQVGVQRIGHRDEARPEAGRGSARPAGCRPTG